MRSRYAFPQTLANGTLTFWSPRFETHPCANTTSLASIPSIAAATGASRSRSVTQAAATAAPLRSAPAEAAVAEVFGTLSVLVAISACALVALTPGALATHGGDREVTVASNDAIFSQNKQNEPAIAVDANHPNILAAGANDNIDMEACNSGDDTTCPFTPDVGGSGIYFSFNSGDTWVQPQYTGLTARGCLGVVGPDPGCQVVQGPIGTLPHYDEAGLVSDGDPALAFGPQPGPGGGFSWANGSRLYSHTRQMDNCKVDMTVDAAGSKGRAQLRESANKTRILGPNAWRYEAEENDLYQTEHDELFASIRSGQPINNGDYMAKSTLLAIMGRMATYTGQEITWEMAWNSKQDLTPEKYEWGPAPKAEIAIPGVTGYV